MSNLIMPENSFTEEERKILPKIMTMNKQMIDDIGNCAQIHIIGRNEDGIKFWDENVLNDDSKQILEPYMGLRINNKERISHFCVASIKVWDDQELYFGNTNNELSEFVAAVLKRVGLLCAGINSVRNKAV